MKLKDLIESNNTGLDAIKRAPIVDYDTGVRCLRIGDISNNRPFNEWGYTEVEDNNYNKFQLKTGDIIVARTGATIGVNKYIDKDYKSVYNNGLIRIRVKQENNPKYVYYLLQSTNYKNFIKTISMGTSTQPNMQMNDLLNLEVPDFDKPKQNKIVEILGKIDDKTELNNEINNNLFELVLNDFNDFLDKNTDAETVKLEDCVEKINTGADAIQRAPIVDYDTGIRCIRIGDMTNGRDYHSWGFTKMTDKDFENYKLIRNDIVITRTAVNGLTYMITDEENTVCNNGNIRLRVNNKYNPLYIYLNTKTKDFRNYIDRINSETSVRPNMKVEYFTSYEIKKIDLEKQNNFCLRAESIMKKIQNNKVENYNLEQLRDTLLPKLMNGDIDLDNIEI